MAREKLSMRKISEVLRLNLGQKLSVRQVATSCGLSRSTVSDYLNRARKAGLNWPLPDDMNEQVLDGLLFGARANPGKPSSTLDMLYIRNEMHRKHVTLQLLWDEYRARTPDGYSYSQYCQLYRNWLGKQAISLRQDHRAGEKLFVDYAGDTIPIWDANTGIAYYASLFVGVLGCSNYTYAEVTRTQQMPDWISSHVHTFEYMQGVPLCVVPDNLKAAVTKACRYEPVINLTYQELAEHYGFAVFPARCRKPKDKAKVECGVLIAERWILAALRHYKFFSLAEANAVILHLLDKLNRHPFKKLPGCRKDVFERLDLPELKHLPLHRYELAQWKELSVNVDYHVDLDGHYYSVPYNHIHRRVSARYTKDNVEIFLNSKRVAVHLRSFQKGFHSTIAEHRPPAHQKYLEWTPERISSWAANLGANCKAAVEQIMAERKFCELGFRASLGVIRLADRYGQERLNRACGRALDLKIVSYRHIENILKNKRDNISNPTEATITTIVMHNNIRGAEYYQ